MVFIAQILELGITLRPMITMVHSILMRLTMFMDHMKCMLMVMILRQRF